MKKSRIVWLIAALLVLATCLTSCGVSTISNVGKYLNKNYDLTPDMVEDTASLDDLKGYTLVPNEGGDEFLLFTNTAEPNALGQVFTSYKVFGLSEGKIIVDVSANLAKTWVDIDFLDQSLVVSKITVDDEALAKAVTDGEVTAEISAAVLALVTDPSTLETVLKDKVAKKYVTVSYTLYDVTGKEVAVSDEKNDARDFGDLVIFNYKAYETNKETGELTEKMDVPEYMELDTCHGYNDTYFYVFDNSSSYKITVYDRSLNVVSVWYMPDYGDESFEVVSLKILNNGDMLFQYYLVQDEDAKKFDYTFVNDGVTMKVDLITKLISVKNGDAKDLDVNYVIDSLYTNEMLYDEDLDENDNAFNDKFDNIATVYYIEDQRLIKTAATKDIVLLSNKGKIQKSLKLLDNQVASLNAIHKVGDDLYAVDTLAGGLTLVKGNGEVVLSVNKNMSVVAGTYVIGERAIYDLELNVVYDLIEEDAEIEKIMDDVIFIREITDEGYNIVALKADSTDTSVVYSHKDEGDATSCTFYDNATFGYYVIEEEDGDLVYYNAAGEEIIKTTEALTFVIGSEQDGLMIMMSTDPETSKATYYTFKVGVAE